MHHFYKEIKFKINKNDFKFKNYLIYKNTIMSNKRKLKKNEIQNILNKLRYYVDIPKSIQKCIHDNLHNNIKEQLQDIIIYPKQIKKLEEKIIDNFYKSIISTGENVGILTAQSIGERQTQMTLNTFHSAGLAIKTVTVGVPRFSELLNTTKNPKNCSCEIYFKSCNNSIQELRNKIGSTITEIYFKKLIKSYSICKNKKKELWYPHFYKIYNKKNLYKHCISFKLNIDVMYEFKLNFKDIVNKIENEYEDLLCIFSPISKNQLDIFVNTNEINLTSDILYINKDNYIDIYIKEIVLPNLNKILIAGIEGITNIYFKKDELDNSKWAIETSGTNLFKLLAHQNIDISRTFSNDMWEIYEIFGIEAVRQFLIDEFKNVVSSDGTYIDKRHILLLVDIMTFSGNITSISRYGMRKSQAGPLTKCSFEESLDNLINSCLFCDKEEINGVSASIMCGKRPAIGTGVCQLIPDVSNFPNVTIKEEKIEDKEKIEEEIIDVMDNLKIEDDDSDDEMLNILEMEENQQVVNFF